MGTLFIRDTRNFEHLLDFTDPVEVKSSGYYFSWSNKEEGYRRIESRIDRCFGNASWNNQYTTDLVEYMTLGLSDHSPLVIRSEVDTRQGGKPFMFFNHMADHKDFEHVVQEGWNV